MERTSRHQNEHEGRDLEITDDSPRTQDTRGNTRRNQKTRLSYCRPTQDYSKSIKWTEAMNKEIYLMYIQSRPNEKGYQRDLGNM